MNKAQILTRIREHKIIALIRAEAPDSLVECARALAYGGLSTIELTMTTPGATDVLERASRALPDVLFGLGTVVSPVTVEEAHRAGARFIVTPAFRPKVIEACRSLGLPVFSGALTPTEACNAWEAGADVIKIFPAEFFGPAYIKSLKAPFPHMHFLPTGGVTPETIGAYLKAGSFATAAGSALIPPDAYMARDWPAITARAREFVAAASRT